MKQITTLLLSFSLLSFIILNTSCNKSSSNTTVLDNITLYPVVNSVTTISAQVYEVVNASGDVSISGAGICWSATNHTPTLSDSQLARTIDTITYASNITGLTANTTY